MKSFQSIKLILVSFLLLTTAFISCKKDEAVTSLADKLENNTMMFNGKLMQITGAGKYSYVSASCQGQNILGGFYINASNSSRDTVEISIDNVKSYTGANNPVENGISGSTCSLKFIGRYRPSGGVSSTIKSIFSGTLEFNGNVCLFREESIGTNVAPKMASMFGAQIFYECYWKCSF